MADDVEVTEQAQEEAPIEESGQATRPAAEEVADVEIEEGEQSKIRGGYSNRNVI